MSTYILDPMHSEVTFKVKHLMITNVTGSFQNFSATMTSTAEDFSDAAINFEAAIDSITTGNEQRDTHLKSEEFFDASAFPAMHFVSTALVQKSGSNYSLTGNLTLKGITKSVSLDVDFGGTMTDFYGQFKAGFEISGTINRSEFGLTWSAVTEAGGVVVSDEVKLHMAVQMIKQA
jgi:polyisoprenoid-binding protein YceI